MYNNALNSRLRHYARPVENRKNNYKSCPQKICSFKTPRKRQFLKHRKKSYYLIKRGNFRVTFESGLEGWISFQQRGLV